jgi:hypothetical protein
VESTARDVDFQEINRRKRDISNNTSQPAKKSTEPVPTSTPVKLPPKSVLTYDFFASLRTTDMNTEAAGTEDTLLKQEALRKPGRQPPIMITSMANLIRLQSNLKTKSKESTSSKIHEIEPIS